MVTFRAHLLGFGGHFEARPAHRPSCPRPHPWQSAALDVEKDNRHYHLRSSEFQSLGSSGSVVGSSNCSVLVR